MDIIIGGINMSNLIFPEGITYKYDYFVGGDYIPTTTSPTTLGNLYKYADSKIIYIPFDTSNITTLSSAFSSSKMIELNYFDTSNVTNMSSMFSSCSSLTTIPQLDTSKVTNMNSMFATCSKLTSIPQLDTSKVTDMSTFFGYSAINNLTYLGGFKDLGKQTSVSGLNTGYFLRATPNITYESIMNVINNLYDRASAGMSTLTLYVHANTMGLLSDADKAIATNKGWILA